MSTEGHQTVHLVVKGKVQGVFYRASAQRAAERLLINGWVRNRADGSVEITATGNMEALEAFVAWCKEGPSGAVVQDVVVQQQELQSFTAFSIDR